LTNTSAVKLLANTIMLRLKVSGS